MAGEETQQPTLLPLALSLQAADLSCSYRLLAGKEHLCIKPHNEAALAEVFCVAQEHKQSVVLCEADALAYNEAWLLEVSALTAVTEYQVEDLVLSVQSGLCFGELQELLAANGHALPLNYPKSWLLADVLALDVPSLNSGLRRTLKEYVLGLRFAGADGVVSFSGGKVVKNVTGYDLHKFYVGSLYSLGVPTEVTLRLAAKPQASKAYLVGLANWTEAFEFCQGLLSLPDSVLASLELLNTKATLPEALKQLAEKEATCTVWAYVACDGPEPLLALFEERLKACTHCLLSCTAEEQEVLEHSLMLWKEQTSQQQTVKVEVGLPWGGWLPFVKCVLELQEQWPDLRLQVRPAIGLLQLGYTFSHSRQQNDTLQPNNTRQQAEQELGLKDRLHALKQQANEAGGWFQISQAPVAYDAWVQALNRPHQAVEWQLMQRLKATYDPNAIVKTRRFGL